LNHDGESARSTPSVTSFVSVVDAIRREPFAVNDSHLEIPDLPGIGIEWDEDAIERYRYEL
jgi:L-alanine-DL-glutamate epimerase-like enolase superfamily enzyme